MHNAANNAILPELIGVHHFLEANSSQEPLQQQVKKTSTTVTSTGGALTSIPGTDVVLYTGVLAAPLAIGLTAQSYINLIGRTTTIFTNQTHAAFDFSIDLPAGKTWAYAGCVSPTVTNTMTLPAAATGHPITIVWTENIAIVVGTITGFTFV